MTDATLLLLCNIVLLQACDAVLALRGKVKAGSWLRTAAKGRAVPIFSVKTSSPEHLTRAVQTILGLQPSPGGMFGAPRGPDADSVAAPPSADLDSAWENDDGTDEGNIPMYLFTSCAGVPSE